MKMWEVLLAAVVALAAVAAGLYTELYDPPHHFCGRGPVILSMRTEVDCPPSFPTPLWLGDDKYYQPRDYPVDIAPLCYATTVQTWSDWPECQGARLDVGTFTNTAEDANAEDAL